jgi:hypothetical protein
MPHSSCSSQWTELQMKRKFTLLSKSSSSSYSEDSSSSPLFSLADLNWSNNNSQEIEMSDLKESLTKFDSITTRPNPQLFQFPPHTFDVFGSNHSMDTFLQVAAPHYDFKPSLKIATPRVPSPTVQDGHGFLINQCSPQMNHPPDLYSTSNHFSDSLLSTLQLSTCSASVATPSLETDDPDETCQDVV